MTIPRDLDPVTNQFLFDAPRKDGSDLPRKDSSELMERPFFSLSKRKRIKKAEYTSPDGSVSVAVTPHSDYGMVTIWDLDILHYVIGRLFADRRPGDNSLPSVLHCTKRDILLALNRDQGGKDYDQLEAALLRLKTTLIETNIRAKSSRSVAFNLIAEYSAEGPNNHARRQNLAIRLSPWLLEGLEQGHVLTVDPDYYQLTGALERAVYRVARKHAGVQPQGFTIRLTILKEKVGSEQGIRQFRAAMKKIAAMPDYPRYAITFTKTARGEEAIHFVDKQLEAPEKSAQRHAERIRHHRDTAKTAWVDAGLHPREFEEAYQNYCEAGHDPKTFAASIRRPRLL